MIYIGYTEYYKDRKITGIMSEESLGLAKSALRFKTERNRCDSRGCEWVNAEFHDSETGKTWSVHMHGVSRKDYRNETLEDFQQRYQKRVVFEDFSWNSVR